MNYIIGVDVGGTAIKSGLFTEDGILIDKWEFSTDVSENGSHILPNIAKNLENYLSHQNIQKERIIGIGFGVPGAVLSGGIANKCANLGWDVVDVKKEFEALMGIKTFVGNDANVAALGEMWHGSGKGYSNAVMITLGTGIGSGVVIDGKIISGAFGSAGEIGHIAVKDDETENCGCGKRGCLEQYSSASGLVRITKKRLEESKEDSLLRNFETFTAKDICDCAKKGDVLALETLNWSMGLLGKAMTFISSVVDPEVYLIGGGLSKSGELILNPIRKAYRQYAFCDSKNTIIKLAQLGNSAGIYGAAKLVLNK